MTTITPVLMVGGAGTRLWPMSRKTKPKQFQALITERTMFQETVLRVTGSIEGITFAPPVIIGSVAYLDLIETQLEEINVSAGRIILEPSAQNTAAVAGIAAQVVKELEGGLAFLLPSDSHMQDAAAFRHAVAQAATTASEGWITTLGIAPDRPETGYGYIKAGSALAADCHEVEQFVEKPDLDRAESYLAAGGYTWNAGHFLFAPDVMLAEMQAYVPDILAAALQALKQAKTQGSGWLLDTETFARCDSISIDYAVMERTSKAAVYGPLVCGWNDVGSWNAIRDLSENKTIGDVIAVDTDNCYLRSDDGTLVTAIGVSDLIVVAHEGSVLVMPANRAQDVKTVIEELKARSNSERL